MYNLFRMSNSSEDQLEWWRATERVIDQIPEISDAVMAIQEVTHSRPLPTDLPVMEQGQVEKVLIPTTSTGEKFLLWFQVQLPPIVPGSDEDNLVKCLDELNINKITTQSEYYS